MFYTGLRVFCAAMQRGKREGSLFVDCSPSFALLLKADGKGKNNFLFVSGLVLSHCVIPDPRVGPAWVEGFKASFLPYTLRPDRGSKL